MQFKLVPNPTFKAPVQLSVPEMKGTAEVMFEFNYKNKDALDKWFAANQSKENGEALFGVVSGWSGVLDKDGAEVEFNKSNLAELMKNYPRSGNEILIGYVNALTESRAKN